MFTILEGEIELTFRGDTKRAVQGSTMNIAANAPHFFRNASDGPARLLRRYTPAGQEEFFMSVGDPVSSRTAPLPTLRKDKQAERVQKRKGTRGQIPNGTSGKELSHRRVTRSRQCRICEAECPGIAAVSAQTGAVGMQEKPYITKILTRARRPPVVSRMLREGYMSQESYHFLAMADHLAQLLHCLMKSVACPIGACDSRAGFRHRFGDVGVMTGVLAVQHTR